MGLTTVTSVLGWSLDPKKDAYGARQTRSSPLILSTE